MSIHAKRMKQENSIVFKYLNYLLVNRPSEKMTDEELAAFVPWDERIRQICRN